MRNLLDYLQDWELETSLALSLSLGVQGYEARQIPTQGVAANRLSTLEDSELEREAQLLGGAVQLSRGLLEEPAASPERGALATRFLRHAGEMKKKLAPPFPYGEAYAQAELRIRRDFCPTEPLMILLNNCIQGTQQLHLKLEEGADVQLILLSQMDVRSAQCLHVELAAHSHLALHVLPLEAGSEARLGVWGELAEAAHLEVFEVLLSGAETRCYNHFTLEGDRSRCQIHVPALAEQEQKLAVETEILHQGRQTRSRLRQHAVLRDRAQGLLIGRQILPVGADEADCHQSARYLVTSDEVRAHSHPVLIIDDREVQAGHAATVSRIDPEQIYYLQSRGIAEDEALRLVTAAFLRSYLERIEIPALREALTAQLLRKVGQA